MCSCVQELEGLDTGNFSLQTRPWDKGRRVGLLFLYNLMWLKYWSNRMKYHNKILNYVSLLLYFLFFIPKKWALCFSTDFIVHYHPAAAFQWDFSGSHMFLLLNLNCLKCLIFKMLSLVLDTVTVFLIIPEHN